MEVFGAIRNFDTFPSCPMYADVEKFVGTVEKQWWVAANERERERWHSSVLDRRQL